MRNPARIVPIVVFGRWLSAVSPAAARFAASAAALSIFIPPPAAAEFYWANPKPTGAELCGVAFESASIGYAVGEFAATLVTTDGGETWVDRTDLEAFGPDLTDVLVLAPGILLAAGESPGLFRSTDAGSTWSPAANPSTARLRDLFRLDASTLFAAGDAGNVLKSTNGGAAWTLLGSPGGAVSDQWWLDASTGYVVGPTRVRRTTNGGTTWAAIPSILDVTSFIGGEVRFNDAQNGWILLDFDTFVTTNGGASWIDIPFSFSNSPIYQNEGAFLDSQTWIVSTDGEGAGIWKTTNGGSDWVQTFDHLGTRGITDLIRLENGTLVAVSSDGDLLRSADVGDSWTNFTQIAGPDEREHLNVIDVHPSGLGFAGGWNGAWMQTTDGGRSWFDPPAAPAVDALFAICVRDPQFILAGGSTLGQSAVQRSTDGGATWTSHPLAANYVGAPQGLAAFADGTCYTVTYGGMGINFVHRSTDHGATWHQRNNGVGSSRFNDLYFLDSQNGFVCGGEFLDATLHRTTNGGGTWTAVGETGLMASGIRDMKWFDAQTGIVCGDSRVQRTTNGGGNWTTVLLGSGATAMDFLDESTGYVDDFYGGVRKTTDAGVTWQLVPIPEAGYIDDVAAVVDGFLAAGLSNEIFGFADGTTTGAPIAASAAGGGDAARVDVWPNPVQLGAAREVAIRWSGAEGIVEARLLDVRGRVLARAPVALDAEGRGRFALDGVRVSAGIAFLEVRGVDGVRASRKVAFVR